MRLRWLALAMLTVGLAGAATPPGDSAVPRYDHIFLIIEENQSASLVGGADAPELTRLANTYGVATNYFAVTHPSEPNYVALIGGATFGILDDDAYYCARRDTRPYCKLSWSPIYVDHTIDEPSIGSQLDAEGLSWKEYNESLPSPGSLAVVAPDPSDPNGPLVYASKHSGFMNFAQVQADPLRAQKIVDFGQLAADEKSNDLPNLAVIIPNLCNDMHGVDENAPADCRGTNVHALIQRGDAHAKTIVDAIMATKTWQSSDRDAIVITFDEDDHEGKEGCCGIDRADLANSGGGRVPTIVIANRGPRGLADPTAYSHYSLLRTMEDAFGISQHLQNANSPGVVPMVELFQDADQR
ncbi:MAG TPA: alkaline phosphatase family protein [Candidatus Acidoferrales bacterium]|nr:alkaline phosphatase family protein [Candidatus Acidoferrales bacterium]